MRRFFLLSLFLINVVIDAQHFKCNRKHSCGCGYTNVEISARIVNGEEARPYSWSMVVSLQFDSAHNENPPMHVCGGTILTESFILTSANCLEGIEGDVTLANLTIVAGIHRRSQPHQIIRKVDQLIIHPNWTYSSSENIHDIALLHLSEPLDLQTNSFISRTCLPLQLNTTQELGKYPPIGTILAVVGWGRTVPYGMNSDVLRQAMVTAIDHNDPKCNTLITNPETQFCAGFYKSSSGPCYGDFGGPIFQWMTDHWEQVGIGSITNDGCQQNSAVSYTRLAYYRNWIDKYIRDNNRTSETTSTLIPIGPVITPPLSTVYECDKYEVPCGCGRRNVQFLQTYKNDNFDAIPYSWSMIVSIRLNGLNKHSCSGTIINESYILTSATCVANTPTFGIKIVAGIHNLSETEATYRKVDRVILHPSYTGILNNFAYDIAILHISEPFDFDNEFFISRACLFEKDKTFPGSVYYPSPGTQLAYVGWGSMNCPNKTDQYLLQQTQFYSVSDQDKSCFILERHTDIQFCAGAPVGHPASCVGDPGSPIFQWDSNRWKQVGITSHMVGYVQFRNLGIFTRIVEYNNWIRSIVDDCSSPSKPDTTTITATPITETILINITTMSTAPPLSYSCNRSSTCGCSLNSVVLTPSRIVGGENAMKNSWSMMVSLQWIDDNIHSCGGSILSNSYILTAAHCVYGYESNVPIGLSISAGMTNLSDPRQIRRFVDRIYIHPEYVGQAHSYRHDIALLHLNESLEIETNQLLTRTCIHRVDPPISSEHYIQSGTRLAVIGWGAERYGVFGGPEILQQVEIFAIDNNDPICQKTMNDSKLQFCAGIVEGGKDSCQGDSGGPIFKWTGQYWEQVGIVSYGKGCANPENPGVYTRLSYYYDYINDILRNDSEHTEPVFSTRGNETSSFITTTMPLEIVVTTTQNLTMPQSSRSNACDYLANTFVCMMSSLIFNLLIQ